MSGAPPLHQQHIGQVSAQDGSRAFVGSFSNCYFNSTKDPQTTLEQAASACHSALFLTDPYVDRESLISAKGSRVAGTCDWITRDESYRSWLCGSTPLLWVSGGPGKGKTMLSIFLTEELETASNIGGADVIFYFCSHEDEKRNTAIAVLRGLLHQIVTKRPGLVKHALPYFETPERMQQTLSSLETLWIIFSKLVEDTDLGTLFCVLDGLDECDDGALRVLVPRIVGLFATQASSPISKTFRLAIVSRNIPGLQGCIRVKLDPDNNGKVASDIERFISTRVDELSRIEGFTTEFQKLVQTALLERAEGTFLWVGFAMHELLQKRTCSQVLEALDALPSGLPAIYSRMLLQIPIDRRRTGYMILCWVTIASRPLQLQELAVAAGVQPSSPLITPEQAIRDAIALCGPFLKVHNQEVGLVHQSARDYLLRKERDSDMVLEAFRIDQEKAHLVLAQTCFDCVAQSSLQKGSLSLDETSCSQESPLLQYRASLILDEMPCLRDSPLLQYAALHWPEHAKSSSALAAKLFDPSQDFFQRDSPLQKHWWATYIRAKRLPLPPSLPLLYITCYLGIIPWIEVMLAKKNWKHWFYKSVNKKGEEGNTALHWAVWGGNEATVRLLINNGADVKAKNNNSMTALHLAAELENEPVLRLLIESKADISAKSNYRETALHLAAESGNLAVVQLLMKSGAELMAKNNYGRTALNLAVSAGNEAVVRMLIDSGADVQIKTNDGWTTLHSAVLAGHEAVVQLLVDGGVDIDAKDTRGLTALQSAAIAGNETMLQLLVDSGADIDAKDTQGLTALQSAAVAGNKAMVRLLIDNGADIDAKNTRGLTALQSATIARNKTMVRLLVDSGADIDSKDTRGLTALQSAAIAGNEAMVRLLIHSGVDIDAKNARGLTALQSAAIAGNETMLQLLVDSGADIDAKDTQGLTALQSAAIAGHEAMVRLLIHSGADIEARTAARETALHLAVKSGHEKTVWLLINKGADIEAKTYTGETALHWAVKAGNDAVVRLLIINGADIEANTDAGETPLLLVSKAGYKVVLLLLIDYGADITAKNNDGLTALNLATKAQKEAVKLDLKGAAF